ncbi:phospho-sugar mutase [Paenibacillus sp. N1-5-1-14]|uniref:phospho-sugar mutase n=1 Tax=Paenibacillus radicibacter TaxID=2972488 RepID=UPI002158AE2A|nr:phospho-sugar mutase [Paenibacillus radicibacter]MCR8645065.1 phospho-sugar mutase [Paenibacillus radicibacter]
MTILTRVQTEYERWISDSLVDEATKEELHGIEEEPKEIEDRFYKDLEFGTGGLRGVMGAGTNRLNSYTIGRATQGLAQYILGLGVSGQPSVAIAYDSRHRSDEFALEAALVLAGNGIKAYVFEELRPTPELSFAVRELGATAGIVITASHNPPEYNGYKVYGADGGQLTTDGAGEVTRQIQGITSFGEVRKVTREEALASGLLEWIGEAIDQRYVEVVTAVSQRPDVVKAMSSDFRIVFTPLHGAGNKPVREVLASAGFEQVRVVAAQEQPDPEFSTVKSPNPEEREAFTLGLEDARAWDADIIVGTDPDADRMGAIVKDASGEYVALSGNQSGALIVNYLLSSMQERGELPSNGVLIKTIVTSEMGAAIAASYGVETLNTLTGFKYIGEWMTKFAASGEKQFLFGYEESYGYLAGTYARDKDAIVAAMLICEAGAYYKSKGKTLIDALHELYASHGYFMEKLVSRTMKGKDGLERIRAVMDLWRANPPQVISGLSVQEFEDYTQGLHGLPRENVIKCKLEGGSWFCLRPSGTEPKMKFYFAVKGTSQEDATEQLTIISDAVMKQIDAELLA